MYRISLINNEQKRVIFHPLAENDNKVISADIDERVSVYDTLTLSVLSERDLEIAEMKTYIEVYDDSNKKIKFYGRVVSREKSMDNKGQFLNFIEAEGMLSLLNDSCQRKYSWTATPVKNVLNTILYNHNQKSNDFKFSCEVIDDIPVDFEVEYDNTYKYVQDLLKLSNRELSYSIDEGKKLVNIVVKEQIGQNRGAVIRLGENMESVSSRIDATNIATRIIPINPTGENDTVINIKSVNNGLDYIVNQDLENSLGYAIERVVENTDLETPAELLSWGKEQLKSASTGELQITSSYMDLAFIDNLYIPISLGDTVNVYNPVLNIYSNVRAISVKTDLFKPYNPTIELATRQTGLSDKVLDLKIPVKRATKTTMVNTYTILENITNVNPMVDTINIPDISNIVDANLYITLEKYTFYTESGVVQTTYPKDLSILLNDIQVGTTIAGNEEVSEILNIKANLRKGTNILKITSTQNGRVRGKVEITTN